MLDENNKSKPIRMLKIQPTGIEVAADLAKDIFEIIGTVGKYGKQVEQDIDSRFEQYSKNLQNALNAMTDDVVAFHFLISEKQKLRGEIPKHKKNFEDRNLAEKSLELILRKIEDCEERIENRKKHPIQQKEISIPTKIEKPVVIESKIKVPVIEDLTIDPAPETMDDISVSSESIIFDQISCKAEKEEILAYFMVLSKAINPSNARPYMSVAEITKMMNKSFTVFECAPTSGFITINASRQEKGILLEFMYNFYYRYDQHIKNGKPKYAYFLKCNFEIFANDTIKNIASNMGRKSIQNLIDLSKYGII